jgi:hypothetical protein
MLSTPFSVRPVRAHRQQVQAAADYLTATYENGIALQLGVNFMLDDSAFDSTKGASRQGRQP